LSRRENRGGVSGDDYCDQPAVERSGNLKKNPDAAKKEACPVRCISKKRKQSDQRPRIILGPAIVSGTGKQKSCPGARKKNCPLVGEAERRNSVGEEAQKKSEHSIQDGPHEKFDGQKRKQIGGRVKTKWKPTKFRRKQGGRRGRVLHLSVSADRIEGEGGNGWLAELGGKKVKKGRQKGKSPEAFAETQGGLVTYDVSKNTCSGRDPGAEGKLDDSVGEMKQRKVKHAFAQRGQEKKVGHLFRALSCKRKKKFGKTEKNSCLLVRNY